MNLPEITEVQRLTLRSGDRLVLHIDEDLYDREQVAEITHSVRIALNLPESVPVMILGRGMSLEVAEVP